MQYYQQVHHTNTILAQQIYTLGILTSPALTKQNLILKQPKQVNYVIKKNYLLQYYQQVHHTNTILAQQIYKLGIKGSRSVFLDRRRS